MFQRINTHSLHRGRNFIKSLSFKKRLSPIQAWGQAWGQASRLNIFPSSGERVCEHRAAGLNYNLRGELISAIRAGSSAFNRSYSYDATGNRLSATDHNGASTSYHADAAGTTAGGNFHNQYGKINYPGTSLRHTSSGSSVDLGASWTACSLLPLWGHAACCYSDTSRLTAGCPGESDSRL